MKQIGRQKDYRWGYGALAAGLTACAAVMIFSFAGRLIGGRYSFVRGDLPGQYAPLIHQFLNALFGPEDLDYSFFVSMGMPTMAVYAYYCLSPFNLIYLLIADIDLASVFAVIGKLALAAFTFQWFSKTVLRNNSVSSVAFSMAYALCGYSVAYYYNILFLDSIYMLPVIMGLVTLFVKEGKWKTLTAAYAYLFLVNFYIAYMIGFFSLILLLVLMAAEYGKSWKRYVMTGLRFAGTVILAALMGAVFLAPAAYALLIDGAPDASGFNELRLTLWDLYGNLFLGQMQTTEGIFPMIYCGVAVVFLVPLFFTNRQIGKKEKAVGTALLAFLLLCSFWPWGYRFLHGFDAPDYYGYRFGFLFSFLLAAVCCAQWNRPGSVSSKKLVMIAALNIAMYYLIYLWQGQSLDDEYQSASILGWEINIIFIVLFCALMCYAGRGEGTRRKAEKLLVVLMMSELIVNGFFCVVRVGYLPGDYNMIYDNWMTSVEETIRVIREEDDGFYRIRYHNAVAQDQSMQFDYMDIPYFCSVEDWRLRETLGLLGYSVSPRSVSNTGGTPVTEMLFGQRYIVMAKLPWEMDMAVQEFYKNETALGLGYMVKEEFQDISLQDNAMENLNLVLQGMTGEEIVCMIPYTGDIRLESENMVFGMTAEETYALHREDESAASARLVYRIASDPLYMPYAYFSQEISIKDTSMPILYSGDRQGTYLTAPAILQMERGADSDSISIVMEDGTSPEGWYGNHYFASYDPAALQEAYEALKDHQLVIRERQGSRLGGTVEVLEDKTLLFTSIPYDKGWRIYVDGAEAETVALLNGAFLGTELTPGTHEIEMSYQSRLNTVSAWISIAACGIFLLAAVWKKEERNNTSKEKIDTNKSIDEQYIKSKKTTGQHKK